MSYQCEHEGCDKSDDLVGLGSPPLYYCIDHFDVAVRDMLSPIQSAISDFVLEGHK